jgi:amino acid transporter
MRLVPLQWASLVVIFLDAVVIAFGFVTGSALLPRAANLVLVVISMALMVATLVFARGAYNFENPTLPAWAVAVSVIAFFGGVFLFAHPLLTDANTGSFEQENGKYQELRDGVVVREVTEEQYDAGLAANQRQSAGFALAFAGGVLAYAGIRHRR